MTKMPSTSLEAHRSVTVEMKNNHYSKIIKALKSLGSGIYEEIADYVGMEKNQVSRRLKEMEADQLVFKSGAKKPTKSGRNAFIYHVVGDSQPKTENEVNFAKVKTTTSDYAKNIISLTQQSLF